MKKFFCILMMLCLFLMSSAYAAHEPVQAYLQDNTLRISWDVCSGCGTATVYQYGWVVYKQRVSGCDGYCEFPYCYGDADTYEVVMRIGSHRARVKVSGNAPAQSTPAPMPTEIRMSWTTPQPVATQSADAASSSSAADNVVQQVNQERAKYGLGSLTVSSELTRAAEVRAHELVQKFSHTRPDGQAWSSVSSAAKGENIAMGYAAADKVMAAWMSSDGHRANILRESFGSIGVCAYRENGIWYWVQLFGR